MWFLHHHPDISAFLQPGHWVTALPHLCPTSLLATSTCTLSSSPGEGRRGEGRVEVRRGGQCLFGWWHGDLWSSWHLLPGAALLFSSLGWKWQADRGGMWGVERGGGRHICSLSQAWGVGCKTVWLACHFRAMVPTWSWLHPLQHVNTFSIHSGSKGAGHLFCLLWQAWSLGDRFLVSDFGTACYSLSTPWLTRIVRLSQGSFPGTLLGCNNSRMNSNHAYCTVNALYMGP